MRMAMYPDPLPHFNLQQFVVYGPIPLNLVATEALVRQRPVERSAVVPEEGQDAVPGEG